MLYTFRSYFAQSSTILQFLLRSEIRWNVLFEEERGSRCVESAIFVSYFCHSKLLFKDKEAWKINKPKLSIRSRFSGLIDRWKKFSTQRGKSVTISTKGLSTRVASNQWPEAKFPSFFLFREKHAFFLDSTSRVNSSLLAFTR